MKIKDIEVFHCEAGWRPWLFIKVSTDDGLVGWSESTDSHGSPHGQEGVIEDLKPLLIGESPFDTERLFQRLYARTRQSTGGIAQKAIGGIENALLDIKGKALGVPVYELFGGKVRDELPLYWSHCGTTRVRASAVTNTTPIRSLQDVPTFAQEIRQKGYRVIKTNIPLFDSEPRIYMPGFFKSEGGPELVVTPAILHAIETYISTLRSALGSGIGIALDLNFNFKTDGYKQIVRRLAPYDLAWVEIDSYDPRALRDIREVASMPICSGENLYGTRGFRPYFEARAMDVASIDVLWNGFAQSRKIADMAELYEMNITPHNYYSHLATFISAQFSATVPNLHIVEYDVDDVPWRDELVSDTPVIAKGAMTVPEKPGWGTEIREDVLKEHEVGREHVQVALPAGGAPPHPSVAIVGPGAIGGLLAALLLQRGYNVTCVAPPQTAGRIQKEGLHVTSPLLGSVHVHPDVASELNKKVDLIFITTKATDLSSALHSLPERVLEDAHVISLLNGCEHVHALRSSHMGPRAIVGSIGGIEAYRLSKHHIVSPSAHPKVELAVNGLSADACEILKTVFSSIDMAASFQEKEENVVWNKLSRLAPLSGTTAASGLSVGTIRNDSVWRDYLHRAIAETSAIARAEGAHISDEAVIKSIETLPGTLTTSLARDISVGLKGELDTTIGGVIRQGKVHGIPTPTLDELYRRIEARLLPSSHTSHERLVGPHIS